jgi:hypothetical protein
MDNCHSARKGFGSSLLVPGGSWLQEFRVKATTGEIEITQRKHVSYSKPWTAG